jgi:hypothetical protein
MNPKPQSEEYKAFENLLGQVLRVSKADLKQQMEKDKAERRPKSSASRDLGVAPKEH